MKAIQLKTQIHTIPMTNKETVAAPGGAEKLRAKNKIFLRVVLFTATLNSHLCFMCETVSRRSQEADVRLYRAAQITLGDLSALCEIKLCSS